jgi:outer membrane immunogenic protein
MNVKSMSDRSPAAGTIAAFELTVRRHISLAALRSDYIIFPASQTDARRLCAQFGRADRIWKCRFTGAKRSCASMRSEAETDPLQTWRECKSSVNLCTRWSVVLFRRRLDASNCCRPPQNFRKITCAQPQAEVVRDKILWLLCLVRCNREPGAITMHRSVAATLLSISSIAGLSGLAYAADLGAPIAAPAPFSWTGCYVGGHIGGVVSEDEMTNAWGQSNDFGTSGFVAGGQTGCDYQFAPRWIVGVEGQAAWTSLKYTHAGSVRNLVTGITLPSEFTLSNDFLASATPRVGYSITDRWLLYAKGGAAWTNEKADFTFTNVRGIAVDPSLTTTRTGWTVGTGVDWAFAPHWSSTLEYNYYDFCSSGTPATDPAHNTTVIINSLKDRMHAVTVGVNYHFFDR